MFKFEDSTIQDFIHYLMQQMKVDNAKPEVKERIEKELLNLIEDRFLDTLLSIITPEQIELFEKERQKNPQTSPAEILLDIASKIPAMNEFLRDTVEDIEKQVLYDVKRLDDILNKHK